MPKRVLGKTGEKLSIIGFGGIMLNNNPQDFANELVAKAYDLGVNYYDVAPNYGNAQEKMGPALKPFRKDCFLACKTHMRDAVGAQNTLEDSLTKLQTDYFDLFQLHALSSVEQVEQAFGTGGAMETIIKAKKEGKIKYVGFSAHSVDAALLTMKNYDFDSILFPLNFACWNAGNFGPQVYAEAEKRGMGILALKAMALTPLKNGEERLYKNVWYQPIQDEEIMKMALKYTLSKNITAAVPPGKNTLFLKALEFMNEYKPISEEETNKLLALSKITKPIFMHT
ncbi:MAG: aldo/keto reductase [Prolixibacteraceae bacterium]|nr:aldo/keto reductase [Prolixibacteraceae bacterium]MBT6007321.1 aldo/keto reductase [Prolixibacteraceae bacterium]MBT6764865.1 aldo/keto reductase [Prolixibacteraceae bacterium]MBT6997107.1 aldo/keto reductase [Prolixibacteraceae bacterium]MBT7393360.1 aldo/keto reductase [Prolixibacteraceae bacterium]